MYRHKDRHLRGLDCMSALLVRVYVNCKKCGFCYCARSFWRQWSSWHGLVSMTQCNYAFSGTLHEKSISYDQVIKTMFPFLTLPDNVFCRCSFSTLWTVLRREAVFPSFTMPPYFQVADGLCYKRRMKHSERLSISAVFRSRYWQLLCLYKQIHESTVH